MTAHESCENCRYWRALNNSVGTCRRFPPFERNRDSDEDFWPYTKPESWCGEYSQKGVMELVP